MAIQAACCMCVANPCDFEFKEMKLRVDLKVDLNFYFLFICVSQFIKCTFCHRKSRVFFFFAATRFSGSAHQIFLGHYIWLGMKGMLFLKENFNKKIIWITVENREPYVRPLRPYWRFDFIQNKVYWLLIERVSYYHLAFFFLHLLVRSWADIHTLAAAVRIGSKAFNCYWYCDIVCANIFQRNPARSIQPTKTNELIRCEYEPDSQEIIANPQIHKECKRKKAYTFHFDLFWLDLYSNII